MSKRRIRRKRRARVKILPLILVGAVIAGVITVIMSVNLKGADIREMAYRADGGGGSNRSL